MKIGYILDPKTCISGAANGVLKQAVMWAQGLRELGHDVEFIGIDRGGAIQALGSFDLVHFFQHGYWLNGFRDVQPGERQKWFFSPVLDSTANSNLYGILAGIPLDYYLLSFGPRLLRQFSLRSVVSVRSAYERAYLRKVAGQAQIVTNRIAVPVVDGPMHKPEQDLPDAFVLFIGNIASARKNVVRLVEACGRLDMPLVLCGLEVDGAGMDRVAGAIEKSPARVIRLGFRTVEELRWLYANCSVFCLPSLIEGVGQVAMEALYFGAKVVITEVGGAREYLGDLATYVKPTATESIASGIRRALEQRIEMRAARERMEAFSILNTARQLENAYRKAIDGQVIDTD